MVGCQAENNCYSQTAQFSFPDCNFCPILSASDWGRTCLRGKRMERLLDPKFRKVKKSLSFHVRCRTSRRASKESKALQIWRSNLLTSPAPRHLRRRTSRRGRPVETLKTTIDRDHLLKSSEKCFTFHEEIPRFSPSDAATRRYEYYTVWGQPGR